MAGRRLILDTFLFFNWHFRKHSKVIFSKLGTRNKRHFIPWEKQGFAAICWVHKRVAVTSDWSQKWTKPINYSKYQWGLNCAKSWHIQTVRGKASLQKKPTIISLITLGLVKRVRVSYTRCIICCLYADSHLQHWDPKESHQIYW